MVSNLERVASKEYNIHNTVKVGNQEISPCLFEEIWRNMEIVPPINRGAKKQM
jgi:hypothetical protein